MNTADIVSSYAESDRTRRLHISRGDNAFQLVQSKQGYGMVVITDESQNEEIERYYALDMAIEDVAERLQVPVGAIEVPEAAQTMGI